MNKAPAPLCIHWKVSLLDSSSLVKTSTVQYCILYCTVYCILYLHGLFHLWLHRARHVLNSLYLLKPCGKYIYIYMYIYCISIFNRKSRKLTIGGNVNLKTSRKQNPLTKPIQKHQSVVSFRRMYYIFEWDSLDILRASLVAWSSGPSPSLPGRQQLADWLVFPVTTTHVATPTPLTMPNAPNAV